MEKVPRMCITCQHYKPYHCELDDSYIGYIHAELRTKCKRYSLSEHYRNGGKFYKYRVKEGKNEKQMCDKTCATCRYYDDLNHECYADNPGADGCWESEDEENVDCGMVTNWRLLEDL